MVSVRETDCSKKHHLLKLIMFGLQIKLMCAECGYSVTKLTRIRIMNVELGNLKTGEYRELDGKELNTLYEQIYKQIETVNIQADN